MNQEYMHDKIKILEEKVKYQNIIIDSYKILYTIQEHYLNKKKVPAEDLKKFSDLEKQVHILYDGGVK